MSIKSLQACGRAGVSIGGQRDRKGENMHWRWKTSAPKKSDKRSKTAQSPWRQFGG